MTLEGHHATLGDCFVGLAKTAAAIKKLPSRRYVQFQTHCIEILNTRFDEFDDDLYLLCYFLIPNFRGKYYLLFIDFIKIFIPFTNNIILGSGLQKGQFRRIAKTAGDIWQKMGKDLASGYILISHLRLYKTYEYPYNESYEPKYDIPLKWWETIESEPDYLQELALKLLAIVPNSASCERNFSLLSWLTNNRRLQLKVENLESIAKMCCFYNNNAKKELSYFSANMTESQVLQILNEANGQILLEEEENIYQDELPLSIDRPSSNTRSATALNLFLESSLKLDEQIFNEDLEYTLDDDSSDSSDSIEENSREKELDNMNQGINVFNWNSNDLIYNDDD